MRIPIFQVDAFADKLFKGNPAAVCPLEQWLSDEIMQDIGMENNLAETAFIVNKGNVYEIRWFTPTVEVDLCGHATLAAAFVIFTELGHKSDKIEFISPRSGPLSVSRQGDFLALNFPTDSLKSVEITTDLTKCFNISPGEAFKGKTDYMLVYASEEEIRKLQPDIPTIARHEARGIIVTAPGMKSDFVSRFFAPAAGVNEDPVTASAHTTLIPYWAKKLGKETLTAYQLSPRSGFLQCKYLKDRVEIGGHATLYMKGEIFLA